MTVLLCSAGGAASGRGVLEPAAEGDYEALLAHGAQPERQILQK